MSLKLDNLSKRFKDTWALRDIAFEAMPGEVFGVFGPSRSGKTTLLDAIAGEFPTNGGTLFLNGHDITKLNGNDRGVTRPAAERGSLWSRLFGSDHTSRRRSTEASLENAKSVLVLDEPVADADQHQRATFIDAVRTVALERNLVVLIASSDYELMLEACDRVAVLTRGEVRQVGSPQDVYEHPNARVVADVTGRNNLFAARRLTSSKAEVPEFHTIEGGHRLFAQKIERGALGALNQNVTLGIRPEHISISFGASFPADNLLKATVTGIHFLGPTTLIELDADGLRLQSLVLRVVGLNVGDECMVGLPPDRILIFRD